MPRARMVIVAGPSGGGKSSILNVFKLHDVDAFNVDDHAARLFAQLRGGTTPIYRGVPLAIRNQAREQMRDFIKEHIDAGRSFAFETTLRDITFAQAREATRRGFRVEMIFIAAGGLQEHIARVEARAERGGHTASRQSIAEIYNRALGHLIDALRTTDEGTLPAHGGPQPNCARPRT